jgi:hypothetical protein
MSINTPSKKRFIFLSVFILLGFIGAYIFKGEKKAIALNSADIKKDSIITVSLLSESFDLEANNDGSASTEKFVSGKISSKLSPEIEYGFNIKKPMSDIPTVEKLKSVSVSFKCWMPKNDAKAVFVFIINDATGKTLLWDSKPIVCNKKEQWCDIAMSFEVKPELIKSENSFLLYAWNHEKKEFYMDDIVVDYIGTDIFNNNEKYQSTNTNLFFDFETTTGLTNPETIKPGISYSGKNACILTGGSEYGPTITKKISDITNAVLKKISVTAWIYPLVDNPNLVLTTSILNSKNEQLFWDGKATDCGPFPRNKWTKLNASFNIPFEKTDPTCSINVNIWNRGKTDIIVDDLEIVYGESPEKRSINTNLISNKDPDQKNKPPFKTIYFEKQEIHNNNSTFINAEHSVTGNFSPNDNFLVGNFIGDKNSLDEIICLKNGLAGLYKFDSETKQFQEIWENANTADSIWNDLNTTYSGDFNKDGKWDVLIVKKDNKDWKIINFDGKEWTLVLKGTESKLNKQWIEKNKIPTSSSKELFKNSDVAFSGNYFGDGKGQLLKLNLDWRFDLKLIEQNEGTCAVLGNVDFKGFENDYNPKYYEFVKIISGKFISKDQSSLLIMMRNCADDNFNGTSCNQFENLPYLPNSTQLYSLER